MPKLGEILPEPIKGLLEYVTKQEEPDVGLDSILAQISGDISAIVDQYANDPQHLEHRLRNYGQDRLTEDWIPPNEAWRFRPGDGFTSRDHRKFQHRLANPEEEEFT